MYAYVAWNRTYYITVTVVNIFLSLPRNMAKPAVRHSDYLKLLYPVLKAIFWNLPKNDRKRKASFGIT